MRTVIIVYDSVVVKLYSFQVVFVQRVCRVCSAYSVQCSVIWGIVSVECGGERDGAGYDGVSGGLKILL